MPLLSSAAKRARLLKLGTNEWYLDEIKNEYADPDDKGYVREDYIRKVLRGYTEADFEFLGLHLPRAPDEFQPRNGGGRGVYPDETSIQARLVGSKPKSS